MMVEAAAQRTVSNAELDAASPSKNRSQGVKLMEALRTTTTNANRFRWPILHRDVVRLSSGSFVGFLRLGPRP